MNFIYKFTRYVAFFCLLGMPYLGAMKHSLTDSSTCFVAKSTQSSLMVQQALSQSCKDALVHNNFKKCDNLLVNSAGFELGDLTDNHRTINVLTEKFKRTSPGIALLVNSLHTYRTLLDYLHLWVVTANQALSKQIKLILGSFNFSAHQIPNTIRSQIADIIVEYGEYYIKTPLLQTTDTTITIGNAFNDTKRFDALIMHYNKKRFIKKLTQEKTTLYNALKNRERTGKFY